MRSLLFLAVPLALYACNNADDEPVSTDAEPTVDLLQPFPPLDTERPEPCDTANPEDTDNPCAE